MKTKMVSVIALWSGRLSVTAFQAAVFRQQERMTAHMGLQWVT